MNLVNFAYDIIHKRGFIKTIDLAVELVKNAADPDEIDMDYIINSLLESGDIQEIEYKNSETGHFRTKSLLVMKP